MQSKRNSAKRAARFYFHRDYSIPSNLIQIIQKSFGLRPNCPACQITDDDDHCRPIRQVKSPTLIHRHLKLDLTASLDDAKSQLVQIMEGVVIQDHLIQNLVMAIDISLPVKQIDSETAKQLAQKILLSIDHNLPSVRDRFVGISDDEKRLPLRDLLCTGVLAWEEIDNIHLYVFE